MSSLMVACDLDLMMLEISIDKLFVPQVTEFDAALMRKTVAMFRLLDKEWTSFCPQRSDYQVYRGSNFSEEPFNGGVSVVFALPQSALEKPMENVDLQLHVHRELSKYFETQSSQNVGFACIDVSDVINKVIEGIKKRNSDIPIIGKRLSTCCTRAPISSSTKDTYPLLGEDGIDSGAKVTLYLRFSHLGHSVISEVEVPDNPGRLFYAREETSETLPYQCRELTIDDLTGGCWGSGTLVPPLDPRDTMCCCDGNGMTKRSTMSQGGEDSLLKDSADATKRNGGQQEGMDNNGAEDVEESGDGNGKGDGNGNGNVNGNGNGNGNVDEDGGDEEEGVTESCLVKPALCGREGTCNKKDKKGKLGKCARPDGEGGNPLACGERRKCARRKSASGGATVGIVDKKPCSPRSSPVCPCSAPRTYPQPSWSSCTPTSPCTRCQPVYYGSPYVVRPNVCQGYDQPSSYAYPTGCHSVHLPWR